MSASKRLRKLEAKFSGPQTYGPGPIEADEVASELVIILPEIIAVIEAAEKLAAADDIHAWRRGDDPALPELTEPLSDLDAKLALGEQA